MATTMGERVGDERVGEYGGLFSFSENSGSRRNIRIRKLRCAHARSQSPLNPSTTLQDFPSSHRTTLDPSSSSAPLSRTDISPSPHNDNMDQPMTIIPGGR